MHAGISGAAVSITFLLLAITGCGGSERSAVTVTKTEEAVTRTTPAKPSVYVPQTSEAPVYKPDVIGTSVESNGIYYVDRWESYGGSIAVADAHLFAEDCKPSCVDGRHWKVTMELRLSRRVPCRGVLAYGRMSIYNASDSDFEGSVALISFCKAGG